MRQDLEKHEINYLSEYACKSIESKGRKIHEEKCDFRTDFQRDRDRVIHSKSFRRLMHKTQVFLAPEGDHFRTRLTHTLEVSQISRTISRALYLNEDLTEAIAMGHDLGHTPFGHSGEKYLDIIHPKGFKHNEQSLRVVDYLEKNSEGRNMNLTAEVRDGILNHTGETEPFTLEGQVVKLSDRIAYINHDIDDALRGGIISDNDLPQDCIKVLGQTHRDRINNLVIDVVNNSKGQPRIKMSDEMSYYKNKLRTYMFENVYHSQVVKKVEDMDKIDHIIKELYRFYLQNPDKLPDEYYQMIEKWGIEEIVKDQIAGMTDRYAINVFSEIFIPKRWK
ncbi:MAG: deoxyguanosinetriphosphate triphosphohydrolase [Clostridia bacterium]|nr:deoxyguanosinetriphosphate triphosphohydrolase [Clostridia bacterium]